MAGLHLLRCGDPRYGGEETYRLKPGIEAIGLKSLQEALLEREPGE
jgi:hypothetical protein